MMLHIGRRSSFWVYFPIGNTQASAPLAAPFAIRNSGPVPHSRLLTTCTGPQSFMNYLSASVALFRPLAAIAILRRLRKFDTRPALGALKYWQLKE